MDDISPNNWSHTQCPTRKMETKTTWSKMLIMALFAYEPYVIHKERLSEFRKSSYFVPLSQGGTPILKHPNVLLHSFHPKTMINYLLRHCMINTIFIIFSLAIILPIDCHSKFTSASLHWELWKHSLSLLSWPEASISTSVYSLHFDDWDAAILPSYLPVVLIRPWTCLVLFLFCRVIALFGRAVLFQSTLGLNWQTPNDL